MCSKQKVATKRKGHLMNLVLPILSGNVNAKQTVALLFAWGVQMIAIAGIAFIKNSSQAGSD